MLGVLARDMMGGGMSAGTAQALGGTVSAAMTGAGTVITDATALNASLNVFTTVASGTGAIAYNGSIGDSQVVYNGGANALKVYPPNSGSQKFNQITAGAAFTLPINTGAVIVKVSSTLWLVFMSA